VRATHPDQYVKAKWVPQRLTQLHAVTQVYTNFTVLTICNYITTDSKIKKSDIVQKNYITAKYGLEGQTENFGT